MEAVHAVHAEMALDEPGPRADDELVDQPGEGQRAADDREAVQEIRNLARRRTEDQPDQKRGDQEVEGQPEYFLDFHLIAISVHFNK